MCMCPILLQYRKIYFYTWKFRQSIEKCLCKPDMLPQKSISSKLSVLATLQNCVRKKDNNKKFMFHAKVFCLYNVLQTQKEILMKIFI